MSEPLSPELALYYQSLIGVMRWVVEIGRIDIATKISHNDYSRKGNFETELHFMGYLKINHASQLAMNPN